MRRRTLFALAGLASLIAVTGVVAAAGFPRGETVNWQTNIYTAHRISQRSGKPMLVVFHADWCGYCKKLEKNTLGKPEIAGFVNGSFVPVHLDFDQEKRVAKILEVKSLPTTVVLSPDADLLGKLTGYVEPEQYERTLEAALQLNERVSLANYETSNGN